MSIVKNDTSSSTAMTIMKLEKVVNNQGKLASPPLPSGHPLIGFATKYYLELNNYSFQLDFYSRAGETVIIRAMIDPDAEGFIYGFYDGNSVRYIRAYDGKLQWFEKNDSSGDATTPILEREIDGKIHNFGYQGYDDNGTLKCKPYYDKENITVGASTVSYTTAKALLFKQNGQSNVLHSTNTWAIRLYEVAACSFPDSADTSQYQFHYYAALSNDSTPVKCLMETRHVLAKATATAGSSVTGVTNRQEIGDFPSNGYGVQLHDLKDITGSGFNDLLAILCEDDGVDGAAGWVGVSGKTNSAEAAYELTKSGESRAFGIYLGSSSSHIPIPSGWSMPSARSYDIGELIKGRKLKWSIWNDAVKFGKYGDQIIIGTGRGLTTMRFNIFKDNNGDSVNKVRLEKFENYDTAKNFAPKMEWDGVLDLEYHNGVPCRIIKDDMLSSMSTLNVHGDFCNIYKMDVSMGGSFGTVRLGNLPLWNYSMEEQYSNPNTNGLTKLACIGGGIVVRARDSESTSEWSIIGTMIETETNKINDVIIPLSTDSPSATVNKFKVDGFDCSGYFRNSGILDLMRSDLLRYGVKDMKSDLILAKSSSPDPSDSDIVDCSKFVPSILGKISGSFDSYTESPVTSVADMKHEDDRMLFGENDGIANIGSTEYLVGLQYYGDINIYQNFEVAYKETNLSPEVSRGFAMGFPFVLKNKNSDTFLKMFGDNSTEVFGYAEVVEEKKTKNDCTSSIETDTIEEYDEDYTIYYLDINKKFGSASIKIDNNDDNITKAVDNDGNITYTVEYILPASSIYPRPKHTANILCSMIDRLGRQYGFLYGYEIEADTVDDIICEVRFVIENIPNDDASRITVMPLMHDSENNKYNVDEEDTKASVTSNDRKICNRLYGFSKPIKSTYQDMQITLDYFKPYLPNTQTWTGDTARPWRLPIDKDNGEAGGLMFMWKDLNRITDSVALTNDSPLNKRPNYTPENSNDTVLIPFTAHVRIFQRANGPHAWDILGSCLGSTSDFDNDAESPYIMAGPSGSELKYMFHNHDHLISSDERVFADCYMSVWNGNDKITDATAWNGKTIKVRYGALHEPKDGSTMDNIQDLCEFKITTSDVTAGYADAENSLGYRLKIETNITYYGYANLGNYPSMRHDGMHHIQVMQYQGTLAPVPGTMYFIDIYQTQS